MNFASEIRLARLYLKLVQMVENGPWYHRDEDLIIVDLEDLTGEEAKRLVELCRTARFCREVTLHVNLERRRVHYEFGFHS